MQGELETGGDLLQQGGEGTGGYSAGGWYQVWYWLVWDKVTGGYGLVGMRRAGDRRL